MIMPLMRPTIAPNGTNMATLIGKNKITRFRSVGLVIHACPYPTIRMASTHDAPISAPYLMLRQGERLLRSICNGGPLAVSGDS